jgi:hypothetical protein
MAATRVRLISELVAKGPLTFQELVRCAEGAYPSDVQAVLHAMRDDAQAFLLPSGRWSDRDRPLENAATEPPRKLGDGGQVLVDLPEPHPLDFDWRFTPETQISLVEYIKASNQEPVAILGAPTLYKYLADTGVKAQLFDKNPSIIQHLRQAGYSSVTECDLFNFSAPPTQFSWAVADPPWYIEHYIAFLRASRDLLAEGGKLLLSVLPRLTRPSAPMDRLGIIEAATEAGFDLIEVKPAALHYASPPFEIEALRSEGLIVGDWRFGDIFCFILSRQFCKAENHEAAEDDWQGFRLGTTIVKIKRELRREGELFDYRPVSQTGSVRLRSVSRRSPARPAINLWTSRNIALTVFKPAALARALEGIQRGESPSRILAGTAREYKLNDLEVEKLQEVLELLSMDAGVVWDT